MRILALETSAKAVSAAITEDGRVLASGYQDTGLTHSRTLMPIVEHLLKNTGMALKDCGAVAVAAGPGSFTGIRIGVSAAKGLAFGAELPAAGVSTLAAMARNVSFWEGLAVCAMDARRGQVYNALFSCAGGQITRLTPDRAVGLDQLAEELRKDPRPKIILGDGGSLCAGYLSEAGIPCRRCVHPGRHGPERILLGGPCRLRHGRPPGTGLQRPLFLRRRADYPPDAGPGRGPGSAGGGTAEGSPAQNHPGGRRPPLCRISLGGRYPLPPCPAPSGDAKRRICGPGGRGSGGSRRADPPPGSGPSLSAASPGGTPAGRGHGEKISRQAALRLVRENCTQGVFPVHTTRKPFFIYFHLFAPAGVNPARLSYTVKEERGLARVPLL